MIDPAMVRPGRLDKLLYVDLPTPAEQIEILRTLMRRVPLDASEAFPAETTPRSHRNAHTGTGRRLQRRRSRSARA